jgi:hypothetical protein
MRATTSAGVVVCVVLGAAAGAAAQPAAPPPPPDTAYQPAAPAPAPTTSTTGYYTPPPYTPPPEPAPRRSWFGTLGLGGMGYVGRERTPFDDGDKGSGVLVEAVAGKWIRDDVAVGARIEAHTDDAEHYTDSSFTVVVRFPITESGRFYVEPGLGIAFHKDENAEETKNGIAVGLTAGYQLLKRRFAADLRFGLAHYRHDEDGREITDSHGLVWVGIGLGFQ